MSGEACVLCGEPVSEPVFQVTPEGMDGTHAPRTFTLLRCDSCGLVMTAPRLDQAELEPYYGPEYWGRVDADNPEWVRRDQAPRTAFLERFRREGRVLDVGCGLGLFLLALDPARWERFGLEVMPAAHQRFELQVRRFAHEVLNVSESDQESLARTLDLSDCPGSWLERRLDLSVRHGCRQPRASHHYDVERLVYLPCVDLLLTDAEMADFVRQVRNDESTPARIRDVRPPVAMPSLLDALEEALGSLKPETSV